jgi:hypothetical protein
MGMVTVAASRAARRLAFDALAVLRITRFFVVRCMISRARSAYSIPQPRASQCFGGKRLVCPNGAAEISPGLARAVSTSGIHRKSSIYREGVEAA